MAGHLSRVVLVFYVVCAGALSRHTQRDDVPSPKVYHSVEALMPLTATTSGERQSFSRGVHGQEGSSSSLLQVGHAVVGEAAEAHSHRSKDGHRLGESAGSRTMVYEGLTAFAATACAAVNETGGRAVIVLFVAFVCFCGVCVDDDCKGSCCSARDEDSPAAPHVGRLPRPYDTRDEVAQDGHEHYQPPASVTAGGLPDPEIAPLTERQPMVQRMVQPGPRQPGMQRQQQQQQTTHSKQQYGIAPWTGQSFRLASD